MHCSTFRGKPPYLRKTNVFPANATLYIRYVRLRYPILCGYCTKRTLVARYSGNIANGQPGAAIGFAPRLPPLTDFVFHVIQPGAKKEMIRIYASWCVTSMQHH